MTHSPSYCPIIFCPSVRLSASHLGAICRTVVVTAHCSKCALRERIDDMVINLAPHQLTASQEDRSRYPVQAQVARPLLPEASQGRRSGARRDLPIDSQLFGPVSSK